MFEITQKYLKCKIKNFNFVKGSKETGSIRYLLLIHLTIQIILFFIKSWALRGVSDPFGEEEIWWWKEIKYSHEIIFQRVELGLLFELHLKPFDSFWGLLVLRLEFVDLVLGLPLEGGQRLVQLRHLLRQVASLQAELVISNIWCDRMHIWAIVKMKSYTALSSGR